METTTSTIENVTTEEILRSWERPRTSEEISDFIARHENEFEMKQAKALRPQLRLGKLFVDLTA
jgi:hypothetical protein